MSDELVAGRYRRVSLLGRGAMGDVWLAEDTVLGRRVAIKQLRVDGLGHDTSAVQRMAREARTAARLHHPSIVSVFDLLQVDDQPVLVMQYVEGESLEELLTREGPRSPEAAATMFAALADGLDTAHHEGVIHRDLKPANILLDRRGAARIADFGIARSLDDTGLTRTGHVIGTVAYLPPDLARGEDPSPASDVWSLGATLYATVEGRAPYATDRPTNTAAMLVRIVTEPVPPSQHAGPLAPLLARMLDSDPARRPAAAQVAAELRMVASGAARAETSIHPVAPAAAPFAPTGQVAQPLGGSTPIEPTTLVPTPPVLPRPAAPARSRSRRVPLLVGAAVVLLAGGGGLAYALASGSGSDRGNTSAASAPPTVSHSASAVARTSPAIATSGGSVTSSGPASSDPPSSAASTDSASASSTPPSTGAFTYQDPTYGYRFTVGAGLVNTAITGADGAVRTWTSSDDRATLTISVTATSPGTTTNSAYQQRQAQLASDGEKTTYKYLDPKGKAYVVSGYEANGAGIFYDLVFVGPHRTYSMQWAYPVSQRKTWQGDVDLTGNTFKPGPR